MGEGLPTCWLCKHIRHADRVCTKYGVYLPKGMGHIICRDFVDVTYGPDDKFIKNRDEWLKKEGVLYFYFESTNIFGEVAAFSDLPMAEM